ncbi:MAG TPA: diacylglycerol kinase family protein [Croceibacterium sp.]|nr:diacylglycerol kinase family protein [Croceibacterium sp.]
MHGTVHLFDSLPEVSRPAARPGAAPAPARPVPLVGVIRNPRSHRNGGTPAEWTGRASLLVETPETRDELPAILGKFAERRVDYVVVDGGDGTVRDVLTIGAGIFGECWPPLIVLPNGKTNALAADLGVPLAWSLADALAALQAGRIELRRPLVVARHDNADARVQGFVFGAGAYTAAIGLGQETHERGAFNALAVGVTALWSLAQAVFGGTANVWRRGTAMRLHDGEGRELPHSGLGDPAERYLVFASTLDRFPARIHPFGQAAGALRVAVLDNSRLGLLVRLPQVFKGVVGEGLRRRGYHVLAPEALQLDIAGRFILDGEAFPAGRYRLSLGPKLRFVVP